MAVRSKKGKRVHGPYGKHGQRCVSGADLWRVAPVHQVAHWDDKQRRASGNYDQAYENAATEAEELLETSGSKLAPQLLEIYPAAVWEDQDECLSVQPEDIEL